jgi:hypothetical protein
MPRTLKHIAAEINANPSLGLTATVKKSESSTDSPIAGTRLRSIGKGRNGLHILVKLVRNGQLVCDVDTSRTYRTAREVEKWLEKWKMFNRTYHGAPAPSWNQVHVEGEPRPTRGRPMTVGQLKVLDDTKLVWVRLKEHGEDFYRCDEACTFTRKGTEYLFDGMDFDLTDRGVPKGDGERLVWDDNENMIGIYHVRLVPYAFGGKKKS